MEKKISIRQIVLIIIAVVLVGVFALMMYIDGKHQTVQINTFHENETVRRKEESEYDALLLDSLQNINAAMDSSLKEIVFYGDEYLCEGVLAEEFQKVFDKEVFQDVNAIFGKSSQMVGKLPSVTTRNVEIHQEPMEEILMRIGATVLMTKEAFTIPADTSETEVVLADQYNHIPVFTRQPYIRFGTVTINGIDGKLKLSDEEGKYLFERLEAGEETYVEAGIKVYAELSESYRDGTPVLFFGSTRDEGVSQFIRHHKQILKHQNLRDDRYIIVCRTQSNSKLDQEMTKAFGYHYIRVDDDIDYPDLAERIYFRMKTLEFLDPVMQAVAQAEEELA